MDKFFDRFKPQNNNNSNNAKKSSSNNNNNFLGNLFGGKPTSFSGQGKSLGGSRPGKVIPMELSEPGPLGIVVEKRPNAAAIVASVVENSQAARAGIQRGDVMCFAGSNGSEEIMYNMFLELAKSNQRPLCFEVRRIQTQTVASSQPSTGPSASSSSASSKSKSSKKAESSAESFARKQAVIAAAEAREKAHKQRLKPIPKRVDSNVSSRTDSDSQPTMDHEPLSEEARKAIAAAKHNEAKTAAELGYNPYETNKVNAGQARSANVAMAHGAIQGGAPPGASPPSAPLPAVAPPRDVMQPAAPRGDANSPGVVPNDAFHHAFETVVTMNDHAAVVNSFGILRKLLINATTKGQAPGEDAAKFRRVRLTNDKIKAAIVDVEGALELLLTTGFQLGEDETGSILVFPPGDVGPAWLPTALQQMEQYEKS